MPSTSAVVPALADTTNVAVASAAYDIPGTKKPKEVKKHGPNSWLKGSKLDYLTSLEGEWRVAHNAGGTQVTTFYDRVTTQWLYMYGYTLPLEEDNPGHAAAPQTGLDRIPFLQDEPDDVVASRKAYWAALRKVSLISQLPSFISIN